MGTFKSKQIQQPFSVSGSVSGSFIGTLTGNLVGTASYVPSLQEILTSGASASIDIYLTGSSLIGTASWANNATTASFALNAGNINTSSLVTTSSFNEYVSSINNWTGSSTSSFAGTASFATIATTANSVPLIAGPGVTINGLSITASVRSVNSIFPVDGNISIALSTTKTGTSASLVAEPKPSLADGTIWVISNDPTPANNGLTYIFNSGSQVWYQITPSNQAANDARYLLLTPQSPLSGSLNLGGYNITNVGTMSGTASLATTASFAISSSRASLATTALSVTASGVVGTITSASYALTSSFALNAGNVNTGSLVTTSSFNTFSSSVNSAINNIDSWILGSTSIFYGTASLANSASYAITASYALNTPIDASSLVTTSSFNTFTASAVTISSFNAFTASAVLTSSFNTFTASINRFTASAVTTSSFNTFTASINTFTASYNTGSFTGSFIGSFNGTASHATRAISAATADSVTLVEGPGISINGLAITASLRTINGITPNSSGNVLVSIAGTQTGTSASLAATPTGSLPDATLWVVSGDLNPLNNGDVYIYISSSKQWLPVAPLDTAAGDARYLKLNPQSALTANLDLGGNNITNVGTMFGTASHATTAPAYVLTSVTSSMLSPYVLTSSLAGYITTSSFNAYTSSVVTTSSFNAFTASINTFTASINVFTASVITTASFNTFTASAVLTSSFNAFTASMNTFTASALTQGAFNTFIISTSSSFAGTSSFATTASFAVSASRAVSSSFAATASIAASASFATTASYITGSTFTSANPALSASYALTASFALNVGNTGSLVTTSSFNAFTASYNTGSFNGSLQGTASWASNATTASYILASNVSGLSLSSISTASVSANILNGTDVFNIISGSGGVVLMNVSNTGNTSIGTSINTNHKLTVAGSGNFTGGLIITGSSSITGSLTITGSLRATSITGSLLGTASTASFVSLIQGPGIEINGLTITASLRTVNGVSPTNGNVTIALAGTKTGTSASLVAEPTASLVDGTIWIISNDPTPANNGLTYIYNSGSRVWYSIAPTNQGSNDARYLMLTPQSALAGPLSLGGNDITSVGTMFGTASWATNAVNAPNYVLNSATSSFVRNSQTSSFVTNAQTSSMSVATASFVTASGVIGTVTSASFALTASYALNAGGSTSGLVTTSSFNSYTGSTTSQFAGTASFASTASFIVNSQFLPIVIEAKIDTNATPLTSSFTPSISVFGLRSGSTAVTSSNFVNRQVEVFRNGAMLPGINLGDGSDYITKTFGSNTITFANALDTDEYIKIKCL
jgi:hypothetical protein